MNRAFHAAVRAALLSLATAASLSAAAAPAAPAAPSADRQQKIQALMEAQGLADTIDQQMAAGRERGKANANQLIGQVMHQLAPSPEYQARFREAYEQFVDELQPTWKGSDVVKDWSEIYGPRFTDAELDQLLAWYRSPLGQKDVQQSREAMTELTQRLVSRYQPVMEQATQHFIDRVKTLVNECHCRKS